MTKQTSKAPTMVDVAVAAGVSTMTVSRALKPNTSVSEATRKKIREAADALGYVLDSSAAGLSSRRTGFVAVTIPSINNANFADTLRGLSEGLSEGALQILLGYTDYDMAEEERLIEQLLKRRPEAIIVTGGSHTDRCRRLLKNAGVPVIEFWDLPDEPLDHVVGFSNAEAGRLMVHHFRDLGFTKIGFIGGDTDRDTRGADRRRGFVAALRELGLEDTRMIASGPPPITMREGAAAMRTLLEKWPDTEAVMCVSDLSAFGAMTECLRNGLSVPQDIAVAGFGAYDIAEHAIPAITTVDVSARAIGTHAAKLVQQLLAPEDEDGVRRDYDPIIKVSPRLIVRKSTDPTA